MPHGQRHHRGGIHLALRGLRFLLRRPYFFVKRNRGKNQLRVVACSDALPHLPFPLRSRLRQRRGCGKTSPASSATGSAGLLFFPSYALFCILFLRKKSMPAEHTLGLCPAQGSKLTAQSSDTGLTPGGVSPSGTFGYVLCRGGIMLRACRCRTMQRSQQQSSP